MIHKPLQSPILYGDLLSLKQFRKENEKKYCI